MGLNENSITNGEEYANLLISDIQVGHLEERSGSALEDEIIICWCKEIKKACISRYQDYIEGKLEDYKLSDKDMMSLYDKAISTIVGDTLESLVEKGDIAMGIDKNGDIVYSSTEQGSKKLLGE